MQCKNTVDVENCARLTCIHGRLPAGSSTNFIHTIRFNIYEHTRSGVFLWESRTPCIITGQTFFYWWERFPFSVPSSFTQDNTGILAFITVFTHLEKQIQQTSSGNKRSKEAAAPLAPAVCLQWTHSHFPFTHNCVKYDKKHNGWKHRTCWSTEIKLMRGAKWEDNK